MICLITILFPIIAIAAGIAVIGSLYKFILEINRDLKDQRVS